MHISSPGLKTLDYPSLSWVPCPSRGFLYHLYPPCKQELKEVVEEISLLRVLSLSFSHWKRNHFSQNFMQEMTIRPVYSWCILKLMRFLLVYWLLGLFLEILTCLSLCSHQSSLSNGINTQASSQKSQLLTFVLPPQTLLGPVPCIQCSLKKSIASELWWSSIFV